MDDHSVEDYRSLLLEIARCPIAAMRLAGDAPATPCARIIASQRAEALDTWQVPEPWSGRLATAPILFISSNPSISAMEAYPGWAWTDEWIADYFENRFGGGREQWILDGRRTLLKNGNRAPATAFWSAVYRRAAELLGREPVPGIDYALTEVVHCKSTHEHGVREALATCSQRYLGRILRHAGAHVLVVLGKLAKTGFTEAVGGPTQTNLYGPRPLHGRMRTVAFLPHPNARMPRTLAAVLEHEQFLSLRRFVARDTLEDRGDSMEGPMASYASTRKEFYRRFYGTLIRRYWSEDPMRRSRKPPDRNWLDFASGKTGARFGWSFHRGDRFSAEIYIDTGARATNLTYLEQLQQARELSDDLRMKLSWEPLPKRRACRIALYHAADVDALMDSPEQVEGLLDWAVRSMRKLEEVFRPAIQTS